MASTTINESGKQFLGLFISIPYRDGLGAFLCLCPDESIQTQWCNAAEPCLATPSPGQAWNNFAVSSRQKSGLKRDLEGSCNRVSAGPSSRSR